MRKYAALALLSVLWGCTQTQQQGPLVDLALGQPGLTQEVSSKQIARGVVYHQITRGMADKQDFFTLSSGIVSPSAAARLQGELTAMGYPSRLEDAAERGPKDEHLGKIVRTGRFEQKRQALALANALKDKGLNMAVRFTAEDGTKSKGPFQISLLELDLALYRGQLISALGKDRIQHKALTSEMVHNHGAIAGVNGGFFAWKPQVGTPGDLAGISVVDGKLLSEATAGRPVLLLRNSPQLSVQVLHNVRSNSWLQVGAHKVKVQGLNRRPGKVLNCGNAHDPLLTRAAHDHVCQDPNEVVVFTADFGREVSLPQGQLLTVVQGKLISVQQLTREQTLPLPSSGLLVHLSGNKAQQWQFEPGQELELSHQLLSEEGEITLRKGDYAFNGGPTLLRNGQMPMAVRAPEGWDIHYPEVAIDNRFVDKKDKAAVSFDPHSRAGFYHGWVVRRHPRTAVGISADNKVYIAVVYGRQPGITAGASVTEMALLLKQLGATEAFNLDGGGSSMMVVEGRNTGLSSDKEGERTVGDALLLMPAPNDS